MEQPQFSSSTPIQVVLVQPRRRWLVRLLLAALVFSLLMNLGLFVSLGEYFSSAQPPYERFHSGDMTATARIARIAVDFTIMPPFTSRVVDTIRHVADQDDVKGVLLVISSPGGLVSDSHEMYHELLKLSKKKPIYVFMKGLAASGGYYIAMGAGPDAPLYADPTTWTGSIGVILPRYNASGLAHKVGVTSDSLATGPLKDTLNPLREMTPEEREVWQKILDESFNQFLTVIDENRPGLDMDQIRKLATGQVYTASQAVENGLIDRIGYEDEVLQELKSKLGLSEVRVVEYEHPKSLAESLLGISMSATSPPVDPLSRVLEAGVPRAMYLFGWHGGIGVPIR